MSLVQITKGVLTFLIIYVYTRLFCITLCITSLVKITIGVLAFWILYMYCDCVSMHTNQVLELALSSY